MIRFVFILLILWPGLVCGYDMVPSPYLFSGRWQLTESPVLVEQYGFQDIQNMRQEGAHLKGVRGHERINDDPMHPSHYKPLSAFHFKKDEPVESHILVQASSGVNSVVIQNTTSIPNRGEFESGVTLHSDSASASTGKFCQVPQGNVAYCNGDESLIWGGNERACHGFLLYNDYPLDRWEDVYENNQDTTVLISGSTGFYVGSTRKFDKVKVYIKTGNSTGATLQPYWYSGWNWVAASGLNDGTSSGGHTLAQTGTVSFTLPEDSHTTFVDENDLLLYWMRFDFSGAIDAATEIYYITVGESQFSEVENIWDQTTLDLYGAAVMDAAGGVSLFVSDEIAWEDSNTYDYLDVGRLNPDEGIIFGSPVPLRGIKLRFKDQKVNTNAAFSGVSLWSLDGWSSVSGYVDTTQVGANTFGRDGTLHWLPAMESGVSFESSTTGYSSDFIKYCYRLNVSSRLSNEVHIYHAQGIPSQDKDIGGYKLPVCYKNRLFLLGHEHHPNQIRYSAFDQPDVFNGEDSGYLYLGGDEGIVSAAVLYNIFMVVSYEQLLVAKAGETYRIAGESPEDWEAKIISHNVGCSALSSMVSAEVAEIESGVRRNICMWQSGRGGVVLSDGATVKMASTDILDYWDSNKDVGISRHRIDDSAAWYDSHNRSYKLLISSGAEVLDTWGDGDTWGTPTTNTWGTDWDNTQLEHNVELECNPSDLWWTKLYRENHSGPTPLQVGFRTMDAEGNIYSYGIDNNGYMYRLEYGSTWDGVPIHQYVHTKDLMLDPQMPMFKHTVVDYLRLIFEKKDFASGATLAITHYADQLETISGVSDQEVPGPIDMSLKPYYTSDCTLGPALTHSFKFEARTSVYEGIELLGLGLYFTPFDVLQE